MTQPRLRLPSHAPIVRTAVRIALAIGIVAPSVALPGPQAHAVAGSSPGYAWGDFNSDGIGDVAISSPGEGIGSVPDAGSVTVLYGTGAGLRSTGSQAFSQATTDVDGIPQSGDHFGAALAVGDFDADGFDDLAIGVPGERLGNTSEAGIVYVLRGSERRLTTRGARTLRQGALGIGGTSETGDHFGWALAAGNFDGDADSDLAIGVPDEDIDGKRDAGEVVVVEGVAAAGLFGQDHNFGQNTPGFEGGSETGDRMGYALASGDFDGNAIDDLAIGVPFEGLGSVVEVGAVYSMMGSRGTGLDPNGTQFMHQDTIFRTPEGNPREHFGFALAAGEFNPGTSRRRIDDLAIGVPGDLPTNSGAVNVVFGTEHGFEFQAEKWFQGKAADEGAVLGSKESGDLFGAVLIANDFDGNGAADLAISAAGEDIDSANDVGGVHVLFSDGSDLNPAFGPNQFWTENSPNVLGSNESGDHIGSGLGSGDYDGDGQADLLIGVPGEDFGGHTDAGLAILLSHNHRTLLISQDSPQVPGTAESGDKFGSSFG